MQRYFNQDILLQGLLDERFISFNIRRSPKNHSPFPRKVTLLQPSQLKKTVIPFSGQTGRMNRKTDILFDNKYKGKCLDPDAFPAVESYPYKIFTRKVALCVCAAQPVTEESFLDAALISMGPLRKELVNFDGFVKSQKTSFFVIPAKAGIQCF